MSSHRPKIGYVPELDGMRGLAICAVMIFHASPAYLRGGFIGVDVFFVLSGFLITSLLLQERNRTGAISLKRFYLRRILRLAPALFLMLAVFVLMSIIFLDKQRTISNIREALIALFYASSWVRAFNLYPMESLGHTWSLSIEEQFYALWPLLLIGMLAFLRSRRAIASVLFTLSLAALGWRNYLLQHGAPFYRLFNGFDTRADALLIGCALGVLLSPGVLGDERKRNLNSIVAVLAPLAAVGLIAFTIFADWEKPSIYRWGYFVVEVFTAILICHVILSPHSSIKSLLKGRTLVWIGALSYGLYLWHFPIYMTMYASGSSNLRLLTLGTLVTLVMATSSYYLWEKPFLRLKTELESVSTHTIWPPRPRELARLFVPPLLFSARKKRGQSSEA